MSWPKFEKGLIIYCRHKNEWRTGQHNYGPRDLTTYEYILRITDVDSGYNGGLDLSTEIWASTRPLVLLGGRGRSLNTGTEIYFVPGKEDGGSDRWTMNVFPRLLSGQNNSDLVIKKLNPKDIPLYLSWPYVSGDLSNILRGQ